MINTEKLTHPTVRAAILALNGGKSREWFALFTDDAQLFDDGNKMDFVLFFKNALGRERFTSIDKVEADGLALYGKFHSDQWGDFKTYFKFHLRGDKIERLDIGQADY